MVSILLLLSTFFFPTLCLSLHICCFCPSGFPVPTISWTKNGVDVTTLPEADSIVTTWELNRVRLEMKNVNVKDAGRYTCKAINPVGSATSTADIIVKSKFSSFCL